MNEKLKFSWGHIIAFVALIFICYATFVGLTYLTKGDFLMSILGVIGIALVLIVVFIGGQQLKGTERRFSKRIIWERILIIGSPLFYITAMIPFLHAFTVYSHNDEIVSSFNETLTQSRQLFTNYEDYSNKRIKALDESLQRVVSTKGLAPKRYKNCGFNGTGDQMQIENRIKALRLLLLDSTYYYQFRDEANKWIEDANKSANTWNVFLLGNTQQIKSAMIEWQDSLVSKSKKELQAEKVCGSNKNLAFTVDKANIEEVVKKLDALSEIYTKRAFPTWLGLLALVICYLLMLFPYFLQDRHTKNLYRLFKNPEIGPDLLEDEQKPMKRNTKKNPSDTSKGGMKVVGSDEDFDTDDEEEYALNSDDQSDNDNDDDDFDYNQTIKINQPTD